MVGEKTSQIGAWRQLSVDLDHLAYDVWRDLLGVRFNHKRLSLLERLMDRIGVDPTPSRPYVDGAQDIEVGSALPLDMPEERSGISSVEPIQGVTGAR